MPAPSDRHHQAEGLVGRGTAGSDVEGVEHGAHLRKQAHGQRHQTELSTHAHQDARSHGGVSIETAEQQVDHQARLPAQAKLTEVRGAKARCAVLGLQPKVQPPRHQGGADMQRDPYGRPGVHLHREGGRETGRDADPEALLSADLGLTGLRRHAPRGEQQARSSSRHVKSRGGDPNLGDVVRTDLRKRPSGSHEDTMHRAPLAPALIALALTACQLAPPTQGDTLGDVRRQALDAIVPAAMAEGTTSTGFDRIADVAERAVPAVVHVRTEQSASAAPQLPFLFMPPGAQPGPGQRPRGAGSGVLVESSGLVLTNHHVIDRAEKITVFLSDGRSFPATVRGDDPETDLALLQLEGKLPDNLPSMRLGDSAQLRLGEVVLAIGSPFELQGSVTMGIVSALGRAGLQLAQYEDYIQTDAAINPGNSGGALVDLQGNLVGLNTAIRSQSGGYDGIGFAIPANLARSIMDRLLADGKVVRGYLGVGLADLDAAHGDAYGLGVARGALVTQVQAGTPAEKAGLRPYDVIVGVDDTPIADVNQLRHAIALKGRSSVRLDLVRDGSPRTVQATLGSREETAEAAPGSPHADDQEGVLEGVRLSRLDATLREQLGLGAKEVATGVVVMEVRPGSDAAEAGLRPGDVILEVNRRPAATPGDVARALGSAERAMLLVLRRGEQRVLFVG